MIIKKTSRLNIIVWPPPTREMFIRGWANDVSISRDTTIIVPCRFYQDINITSNNNAVTYRVKTTWTDDRDRCSFHFGSRERTVGVMLAVFWSPNFHLTQSQVIARFVLCKPAAFIRRSSPFGNFLANADDGRDRRLHRPFTSRRPGVRSMPFLSSSLFRRCRRVY